MNTAKEHYDQHLGIIYSWMAGDADAALDRNRSFFRQLALEPTPNRVAIDLELRFRISVDSASRIRFFSPCCRFLRHFAIPVALWY